MKTIKYYHKNSEVVAFERFKNSDGFSTERTFDKNGNQLTYKNSNGYSWERTYDEKGNERTFKDSNGFSWEATFDEKGNELTYKDSTGTFKIKDKSVTKEEFEEFITNQNRPCVGKKVVVDGVEYELK
jgi:hypothetical protein